jgi:hypothetical protein
MLDGAHMQLLSEYELRMSGFGLTAHYDFWMDQLLNNKTTDYFI